MAQYVCRYRKSEPVRWISHLDLKRTLERAMRRAGLPLALTQGHNPHPKLSLGPPLPLGATGAGELLAIHLDEAMDPDQLKQRLNASLPAGLEVAEVWSVPAYRKKETFGDIDVAEYLVAVEDAVDVEELRGRVADLMARSQLVVERGGERPRRTVDVRPHILLLEVLDPQEGEVTLRMRLRTGSHGGARPQEVISLLGLADEGRPVRYHRTGLYASARASRPRRRPLRRRWQHLRSERERS